MRAGFRVFGLGLDKNDHFKLVTDATYIASFETKIAPIESYERQLSIDTNFALNGKMLTFVICVF